MDIFNLQIAPGQKVETTLPTGAPGYDLPAVIVCGGQPGKTLLLTAQIHALEYNGTPALLSIAQALDAEKLRGNVIILPCVNLMGFLKKHPRTLPEDGFNLNADFPERADCPVGSRLAGWFIREVFPHVDFICDLHGGSVDEPLSPCLYYPRKSETAKLAAEKLDVPAMIASDASCGLYSCAWAAFGIPGILLERGWGCTCREEWIWGHERNVRLLMQVLNMYDWGELPAKKPRSFTESIYLESDRAGLWYPAIREGQAIARGQLLGRLEDFRGNILKQWQAEADGYVYYYTAGLSVQAGTSLAAYGVEEEK